MWPSHAVNSGRASISRASSISVSGGRAVRSTSARGAIASRRAPTSCGPQSPTTRSTAPAAIASRASASVSTVTDTRVEIPGSQPSSIASSRPAASVRRKAAPVRARASSTSARAPARRTLMRQPGTPRASRSIATGGSTTQAIAGDSARAVSTGSSPASRARATAASSSPAASPTRARVTPAGVPVTVRQNVTLMQPPRPAARGRRLARDPAHRPGPGPGAARPGRGSRRRSGTRGRS